MQEKDKIIKIRDILNSLTTVNDLYSDEDKGFYFDYDTVIELLQQVNDTIDASARCPRPDSIPSDIPWCESMNSEFDPYVFRNDMSVEEFSRAQKDYFEDSQARDEDEDFEV